MNYLYEDVIVIGFLRGDTKVSMSVDSNSQWNVNMFLFLSSKYFQVEWLDHLKGIYLILASFPEILCHLTFATVVHESSSCTILMPILDIISLINHPKESAVV